MLSFLTAVSSAGLPSLAVAGISSTGLSSAGLFSSSFFSNFSLAACSAFSSSAFFLSLSSSACSRASISDSFLLNTILVRIMPYSEVSPFLLRKSSVSSESIPPSPAPRRKSSWYFSRSLYSLSKDGPDFSSPSSLFSEALRFASSLFSASLACVSAAGSYSGLPAVLSPCSLSMSFLISLSFSLLALLLSI